jgi:hypothetical protein
VNSFVFFGSEKWAVNEMDMKRLVTWESRMLRRIHRPRGRARNMENRTNQERRELYRYLDIVKCTLVQALRLCTGRTAHGGSRGIALLNHDHNTRSG